MSTVIHFIGLDVHKESVSVSIAPIAPANSSEVRFYGNIGGALADVDRLIKKVRAARRGTALLLRGRTHRRRDRDLGKGAFPCQT